MTHFSFFFFFNHYFGFTVRIIERGVAQTDRGFPFLSAIPPATNSRCTANGYHNGGYVIPLATMHNNTRNKRGDSPSHASTNRGFFPVTGHALILFFFSPPTTPLHPPPPVLCTPVVLVALLSRRFPNEQRNPRGGNAPRGFFFRRTNTRRRIGRKHFIRERDRFVDIERRVSRDTPIPRCNRALPTVKML